MPTHFIIRQYQFTKKQNRNVRRRKVKSWLWVQWVLKLERLKTLNLLLTDQIFSSSRAIGKRRTHMRRISLPYPPTTLLNHQNLSFWCRDLLLGLWFHSCSSWWLLVVQFYWINAQKIVVPNAFLNWCGAIMDYDEKMWSVKSIKGRGSTKKSLYNIWCGKIIFSLIFSKLFKTSPLGK